MKELLGNLKYKKLEEFSPQQQEKLEKCFASQEMYMAAFRPQIYVRVFEQQVHILDEKTEELLWTTKFTFASFVFLDKDDDSLLERYAVPLRPFRIRCASEIHELNELLNRIQEDFDKVDELAKELGDNIDEERPCDA